MNPCLSQEEKILRQAFLFTFYKNIRRPFIDKMGVLTYNFKQIVPPW